MTGPVSRVEAAECSTGRSATQGTEKRRICSGMSTADRIHSMGQAAAGLSSNGSRSVVLVVARLLLCLEICFGMHVRLVSREPALVLQRSVKGSVQVFLLAVPLRVAAFLAACSVYLTPHRGRLPRSNRKAAVTRCGKGRCRAASPTSG